MKDLHLHIDTVRRLLRRHAKSNLENMLAKMHAAELALIFRHISPEERIEAFLTIADVDHAAAVMSEMDEHLIEELITELPIEKTMLLMKAMSPDDEADILQMLPEELAEDILNRLKSSESEEMETLMAYPENSAGGLMIPDVFALHEDITVVEAIASIQNQDEQEMVFYLYVVDDRQHLVGVISLRDLITSKPKQKLGEMMLTRVHSVNPLTDQEEVAAIVSRYNILAVPVVDDANKLMGIITVDDVIDVIREEATEDFLQMAGAGRDRDILMKSALSNAKTRVPWLFASWMGGMLVASIITTYEETLGQVLALMAFLPIIIGMAGNVGTQTATIIVRGIATGRVSTANALKLVLKELQVGFLLGGLYGVLLGGAGYLLGLVGYMDVGVMTSVELGITVGIGIILAMATAAFVGALVPVLLHRINLDPAVATGPFVTTSVDILGVVVYFIVAGFFIL
ncbi:MAG: magnesium transporter [Candidatus Marinimicrobia bacterium]|jgi:magnesium transporter|nr:magnesium transporter [Candidatus Neomarinimicrobiota bacterium]MBT3631650.1 magnesium transporter [Candidatus Neomarinimicrobiota bacterium]MBT3825851.1 magnesium transporter [Candidatus Neomarinimicrobiota bacterium]MBT4129948.1 magnesium transporter [Candidatus Neomarinimicrobiota bacterium]MBT4296066.1 magnesium transporter [Candidatus Neomarinimicrobiota bacterium]